MKNLKTESLLDISFTIAYEIFKDVEFPWEILTRISDFVLKFGKNLPDSEFNKIGSDVWISKSASVSSNSRIEGPSIIDSGAQIRFGAFIRGNTIVGKNAVIGNSTELKNCIIFDNVQTPHFNYVGDSILGYKSHIGAGVILSNVKSDKGCICINYNSKKIETKLKKFGAILGDFVEIGCNAVLNPGSIIGRNSNVYPLTMVRGVLAENHILKNNGQIVKKII